MSRKVHASIKPSDCQYQWRCTVRTQHTCTLGAKAFTTAQHQCPHHIAKVTQGRLTGVTLCRRVLVNSRWSQQWNRQPLLHLWGNQAGTVESERRSSQFAALQAHFLLCRMFVSFYCIFIYQFFKCPSLGACLQPGTPNSKAHC